MGGDLFCIRCIIGTAPGDVANANMVERPISGFGPYILTIVPLLARDTEQ
jgi:hypothetical protein